MNARLPYKKISLLALTGLLSLAAFTATTLAQENTSQSSVGAIGIQVSSPIYNFGIDPGGFGQDVIKIRNVGASVQTFYPEVFDFKPLNETGTPQFILAKESKNYTYSLASWIKISTEGITLKPNQPTALNFTINVPKGAEPGGRYAGILFGTSPPQTSGTQIAISNKVGALVLVRVSGDAKELATLKEFSAAKNFYEYPPVDLVVRVENKGNVHVAPKGNIEIKDIFGRKVAVLPVNEKNGNALPESTRRFDKDTDALTWKPGGFTIGRFSANLLLTYGDSGKQLSASLSFWVIPWKILLVLLLAIIILILLIIFGVKRYNRWIVSKAKKIQSQPSNPSNSPPPAG